MFNACPNSGPTWMFCHINPRPSTTGRLELLEGGERRGKGKKLPKANETDHCDGVPTRLVRGLRGNKKSSEEVTASHV